MASAAACLFVTRLAPPLSGQWEVVSLLYFAPVMLTAWFAGLGPGLLATALIAGATAYDGQHGAGSIRTVGIHSVSRLALFVAESGLLAYLTHRARQAANEVRRYRAAHEANWLKDDFLALLSHELRTPLSTILGWTRVLRGGSVDRETTVKALDSIERNVHAQTTLIDDLLDFSHILSGRLRLKVGAVELGPLITAAADAVRADAAAKAVALEVALDPRAGAIAGDPTRLQQIVSILAGHAVGVTPAGGTVRLLLVRRGPVTEIKVSDTGPGIAPDVLPHVFEPLRRPDRARIPQQRDLRLGLAIARHLTEFHGGTIRAESPGAGRGTTFTLSFPVRIAVERALAEEGRPRAVGLLPPEAPGPPTSSRA